MNFDINGCKNLNDICRKNNLTPTFNNRQKIKEFFEQQDIDWKKWKEDNKDKLFCLCCGKLLKGFQKKFCSSSCAAKVNNCKRGKRSIETRQKISDTLNKSEERNIIEDNKDRYCLYCGKLLKKYQQLYCSNKCQQDYKNEQWIKDWKDNKVNGISGEYGISKRIKDYFLKKYNYSCQMCGWNEVNKYTGKTPLEIHHIDGDYTNNKEDNLQLLCPNCHSLTETFKSHNKNGRGKRKKTFNKF